MKKEMLIMIALLFGVSLKSYAGTGNTNDGLKFFLVIIGSLFIILGLLNGVDYLQKNGKAMINKATSFLKNKITLLKKYLNKVKFDYFDLSYF
jgi:hypothetical protein